MTTNTNIPTENAIPMSGIDANANKRLKDIKQNLLVPPDRTQVVVDALTRSADADVKITVRTMEPAEVAQIFLSDGESN